MDGVVPSALDGDIEFAGQIAKLRIALTVARDHILDVLYQFPRVDQFIGIQPRHWGTRDVAHVVHAGLHGGKPCRFKLLENIGNILQ